MGTVIKFFRRLFKIGFCHAGWLAEVGSCPSIHLILFPWKEDAQRECHRRWPGQYVRLTKWKGK